MELNRNLSIVVSICCLVFVTGCVAIPRGNEVGQAELVSFRTNSEGRLTQRIVTVPTYHHVFMPFSAEGMQIDYVNGATWRYYLQAEDQERAELHFLQMKGANATPPWDLVAPVSTTNLWVAVMYIGSSHDGEHKWPYRIICFNRRKVMSKRIITPSEYGHFHFDTNRNQLVYEIIKTENSKDHVVATEYYDLPKAEYDK
jgi:hypothetical protein